MLVVEIEWWSYFGHLLKVKLSEFASRVDVEKKKKKRAKDETKVFSHSKEKDKVATNYNGEDYERSKV